MVYVNYDRFLFADGLMTLRKHSSNGISATSFPLPKRISNF